MRKNNATNVKLPGQEAMQTRAAVPLRPPAIFHTCNSVTLGLSRRTGQDRSILNFSELPVRGLTHRGASFHCAHTLELYWGIVSQVMDTDKKSQRLGNCPPLGMRDETQSGARACPHLSALRGKQEPG